LPALAEFRVISVQEKHSFGRYPKTPRPPLLYLASQMPELLGFDPAAVDIVEDEQQLRLEEEYPPSMREASITAGSV
jgi:hypothetical protein